MIKPLFDLNKISAIDLFSVLELVIDDGHGQETKGKRSPDSIGDGDLLADVKENHVNEAIMRKTTILLDMVGAKTHLTAPEWQDISLDERCNREHKITKEIVLKKHKKSSFVSIHNNAAGKTGQWNDVRGTETFHLEGSFYGKIFANIIHQYIRERIEDNTPDRGVKTKNFKLLRGTIAPAIILEFAFMTNKLDSELLQDDQFLNECAMGLFDGLVVWATYWRLVKEGLEDDFVNNPEYIEGCIDRWYTDFTKASSPHI